MTAGGHADEAIRVVAGRDHRRRDLFAFLVKRGYRVDDDGRCVRLMQPPGWQETDEYYGDPACSSVRFESDLAPFKGATDVVVVGHVHAPGGDPVAALTAGIEIGTTRKAVAVFGARTAAFRPGKTPVFSDPAPFTRLALVYERAYGGVARGGPPGLEFAYPRNPVGRGLAVGNTPASIEGLKLPNFENPQDLLTPERLVLDAPERWNRQPLPQGLGWYGKTWYPRSSHAGALPGFVDAGERMREEALGLVPVGQIALGRQFRLPSFDVRFNNGASPGLAVAGLSGDEAVRLVHLTPEGRRSFRLPGQRPTIVADIGAGERETDVALHSVVIQPDALRVDLVWRGALHHPGADWLPHMRRLTARVA